MEEFFIFILFVLVVISLLTASSIRSRLSERVSQLGKTAAEKDNALLKRIISLEAELTLLKEQFGITTPSPAPTVERSPQVEAERVEVEIPEIEKDIDELPDEELPFVTDDDEVSPFIKNLPFLEEEEELVPEVAEVSPEPEVMPPPPEPATPKVAPAPKRKRTSVELEALIGGKLLNRVGALAVILGIGFFLKYAFDNNMIPEWMRVLIGAAAGGLLLFGGMRFHKKGLPVFAQGLAGAGIAALYLSVFASYNFYHLIPQYAAFGLMSGVTIIGFLNALRYNSPGVAALAWAGGFLTPFMLASGNTNVPGLFTYLALLDVGMIAITLSRPKWIVFEPMSFGATELIWILWMTTEYQSADFAYGLFFALLFWLIFAAAEVYRQISGMAQFRDGRLILSASVAAVLYFSLNSIVRFTAESVILPRNGEHLLAAMLMVIAGIYLLSTIILRRREQGSHDYEKLTVLTAYVLAALAIGHEGKEFWRVIAWSILAIISVLFAARLQRNYLAMFGVLLLGFAFVWLLKIPDAIAFSGHGIYTPLANMRLAGFIAIALGFGLSAKILRVWGGALPAVTFLPLLSGGWAFVAVMALTVEINDYFMAGFVAAPSYTSAQALAEHRRMLTEAMGWMIFSVMLGVIGSRSSNTALRYLSAIIASIAIVITAIICIALPPDYVPILNLRTITLALCAALALVNARLHSQTFPGMQRNLKIVFMIAGLLLIFQGITVETWQGLMPDGSSSIIDEMWYHRQLAIPAAWMALGLIYVGVGAWRKSLVTANFGLVLAAMAALTGFVSAWNFVPIQEHTLVFNYRAELLMFLAVGALAAGWYGALMEKYRRAIRITANIIALTLIFQVFTVEPWQHFGRFIYNARTAGENFPIIEHLQYLQQLALSAAWMALGLIYVGVGAWRKSAVTSNFGQILIGMAVLTGFVYGWNYIPIQEHTLILNYRAGLLVFLAAGVLAAGRYGFLEEKYRAMIRIAANVVALTLIFQVCTVESWQHFDRFIYAAGENFPVIEHLQYLQHLTLSAAWMALGLMYVAIGRWRMSSITAGFGLTLSCMAALTGFAGAWNFIPVSEHVLVLNYRAALLLFLSVGAFIAGQYSYMSESMREKYHSALRVASGGMALVLIFQLITVEPWHYFERLIRLPDSDVEVWKNARQLAVSSVWILYSLSLTAAGFLRRRKILRISAFVLFGITILKVFLYDLSFLTTLYRIFSFIGLGVVLLGISYIYQKYKDRLFGAD